MARDRLPKPKGIANKHLHARTTFLYQAATYLTLQSGTHSETLTSDIDTPTKVAQKDRSSTHGCSQVARQLGSDLQTVSRKGQIKLSTNLKRNICKSCNTILIPGRTATHQIQNDSRGSAKPWADVLVVACALCGSKKRFPVGAKPQQQKKERSLKIASKDNEMDQTTASVVQTTRDYISASVP